MNETEPKVKKAKGLKILIDGIEITVVDESSLNKEALMALDNARRGSNEMDARTKIAPLVAEIIAFASTSMLRCDIIYELLQLKTSLPLLKLLKREEERMYKEKFGKQSGSKAEGSESHTSKATSSKSERIVSETSASSDTVAAPNRPEIDMMHPDLVERRRRLLNDINARWTPEATEELAWIMQEYRIQP